MPQIMFFNVFVSVGAENFFTTLDLSNNQLTQWYISEGKKFGAYRGHVYLGIETFVPLWPAAERVGVASCSH